MAWIAAIGITAFSAGITVARAQDEAPDAPAGQEQPAADQQPDSEEYYELMRVFVDTFEQIDRNYVKDIDRRELVEAAVRGMLAKLDPYSDYISPDDLAEFKEVIDQEFGGVGIQVHWDAEHREIEVVTPLPGSPAYAAGIRAGDRIVEIEGEPVKGFPEGRELQQAVEMLKGPPGEEVSVGVKHPDVEEIETIKLTRDIIQLDTVLGDTRNADGTWNFMLDEERKIGYIRLTHFTRRSADEMREALRGLRDDGMQALILDLRFNPGGLLQAAIEISDMFIEEGVIVSTDGRNSRPRSWYAKRFGTYSHFPMAVLVNRFSASASEILSACLQDHERAVVIGQRSWGKGSVQNVIELEGGDSALKLTTASYHRPSGKNIHRFPDASEEDEWGVSPNEGFEVAFSLEEVTRYQEYRRARDLPQVDEPAGADFVDTQLDRAVEYITGELTGETPDRPADEEKATEAKDEKKQSDDSDDEGAGAALDRDLIPLVRMKLTRAA
ncbi:MAG: S41 family peptidase [Planctomycetota bacterium]|nr:MAG: S41 family peptidase [Planctomycetota bacterium]REJ94026.1 MAG: S41 family peptidase [Planctomycetota bacterium]REK26934.1 MAG: S41 family peptidase [Planctomycetota bacterium]REK35433.1 MAG: S41 family peptidase [Planctomycetota bacterium]